MPVFINAVPVGASEQGVRGEPPLDATAVGATMGSEIIMPPEVASKSSDASASGRPGDEVSAAAAPDPQCEVALWGSGLAWHP